MRIGIDVGGTFTDVVLVNDRTETVGVLEQRPNLRQRWDRSSSYYIKGR
jgi:N-methylhydantoinase A/oxoprolinase/acetone carboxylase beta subunit